jgi:PadR family transcriptional regulator PadR
MVWKRTDLLQGTLDLMVLTTLQLMGPMHGYGLARRIEHLSEDALALNQGTLYPALVRLEQRGWITSAWGVSDTGRRARFYRLTATGCSQLRAECESWERTSRTIARFMEAQS